MIDEQNWYDNILQHFIDREKPKEINTAQCQCKFCQDVVRRKTERDINEWI